MIQVYFFRLKYNFLNTLIDITLEVLYLTERKVIKLTTHKL